MKVHGNGRRFAPRLMFFTVFAGALSVAQQACFASAPAQTAPQERSIVFIVPGTAGNADFWPTEVSGKATFASELKSGFGPGCNIYPYLWDGNNDHASRSQAASSLAKLIDKKAADYEKVFLVGHSYGGDIALLAAGQCRSKIEGVICLSTPSLYLKLQSADKKALLVPVYCSFESRQNAKFIINLFPNGDGLIMHLADLVKGVTERIALPLTQSWQEHLGFPRLTEDSNLGRFLSTEQQDNFRMSEQLNIADSNEEFQSFINDANGLDSALDQHSAVHSRRMGELVGQLLKEPSKEHVAYIHTLIQPNGADHGEPVTVREQENWNQAHSKDFRQIGWRLSKATVTLTSQGKTRVAHGETISLTMLGAKAATDQRSRAVPGEANKGMTFENTRMVIGNGDTVVLRATANAGLLGIGTDLGGFRIAANDKPPEILVSDKISWSADLVWEPVHY